MKLKMLASAAICVVSFSANAEDLILRDSETKVLKSATYVFDKIDLGRNATILLTGTTTLSAEKMITDTEAKA